MAKVVGNLSPVVKHSRAMEITGNGRQYKIFLTNLTCAFGQPFKALRRSV